MQYRKNHSQRKRRMAFEPLENRNVLSLTVPTLHSNPSSTAKIHLDFDGHLDTYGGYNSGNAIDFTPYSSNADFLTFTQDEIDWIQEIWSKVAEDFAPFNVDVTTEEQPSIKDVGVRVMMTSPNDTSGNAWYTGGRPGFSAVNTFANGKAGAIIDKPLAFVLVASNDSMASHEVGHSLGLNHDGTIGGPSYYSGHLVNNINWYPIMGTHIGSPNADVEISQWSKGEYANANNQQDDLAKIAVKIPFRSDDHGNSTNDATSFSSTNMSISGVIGCDSLNASSCVQSRDDQDYFTFTVPSTQIVRAELILGGHSNLDAKIDVYDGNGTILFSSNPVGHNHVETFARSLQPGNYYISVDGVGNGTPSSGYSEYGSLGQYTLKLTSHVAATWVVGDFDFDGAVDTDDIDIMFDVMNFGSTELLFDLDGSGAIDVFDVDFLIQDILDSEYGDINLDGQVTVADLNILARNYRVLSVGANWEDGDLNGDGKVNVHDLNLLARNWQWGT